MGRKRGVIDCRCGRRLASLGQALASWTFLRAIPVAIGVAAGGAFGEGSLADRLEIGYQQVAGGQSALTVFQEAIQLDSVKPKEWALGKKGDPLFAPLCSAMGLAYQVLDKTKEARELLTAAAEAKPSDITYRLQLGELHWQMRNYELGYQTFEAALELNDRSAAAWHGKGRCLQDSAEPEKALKAFERAVELSPKNVTYLRDLGRLAYHLGDLRRALKLLQDASKANPKDTSLQCEIGWIHLRSGKLGDALSIFARQTKEAHADASCWFGLGTALVRLKRLEEAIAPLRKACELDSEAQGYWRDLGNIFFLLERYQEAAEAYRNSLAIEDDQAVVWDSLGNCLAALFKWQEALAAYVTASSLDPMGDSWGNQMHALNQLKRYSEALEVGRKALALGVFDPKDLSKRGLTNPRYVCRIMAESHIGLKRYEDALAACDAAEKVSRETGSGVYHRCYIERGDALVGLGQIAKAREAYKKAMRGEDDADMARRRLEGMDKLQE